MARDYRGTIRSLKSSRLRRSIPVVRPVALLVMTVVLAASGRLAADPAPPKKAEPLVMAAESVEIDVDAKTAVLTGKVKLTRGEMKVSCPRVDVKYDQVPHVTWARGTGGVVAEVKGVKAEAPAVEIDLAAQTVVLTGGVRVTQGEGWLTAERATVHTDTGKITLSEVKGSIPVPGK
jgi:lipopolysaccharide export system protein LptA